MMAREPLTKERQRELHEELARAIDAATAAMNSRDFRAWARVILLRHELGQPVSNYALECARQASQATAAPPGHAPFVAPFVAPVERAVVPARPAEPPDDDWADGCESIFESAEEDA